jgi:hypothetical protein
MVSRICSVATTLVLLTCTTMAHSQSLVGQSNLRARLPFSGAEQPASLQSAVKSQPRPSTSGGWTTRSPWSYSTVSSTTFYRPVAPWLPSSSAIAPTRASAEDYPWTDGWESEQSANEASTQAILNAMSTRPNLQPGFVTDQVSSSNTYPINFESNPPIAQPNAASSGTANQSDGAASTPSQQLSVPSAATSAPIPY